MTVCRTRQAVFGTLLEVRNGDRDGDQYFFAWSPFDRYFDAAIP
jgi:hypothetical protein